MDRVPRIHIRRGRQVQVGVDGRSRTLREGRDEVVAHAVGLFREHKNLYIVDLDGHRHGEASLGLFQQLERQGVPIWLEAGFRTLEDVMDGFFAGAERVTVRLQDMRPDDVREVSEIADSPVYLGVETDEAGVSGRWRDDQVVGFLEETGADGLLVDDKARLGALALQPLIDAVHARHALTAYATATDEARPPDHARHWVVDAP